MCQKTERANLPETKTHAEFSLAAGELLIHLYHAVDFTDEPETGKEPYRTGQQEEQEHHNQSVAEVEEGRGRILNLQLRGKIVTAVHEQIDGGEAGSEERSPPPMVVLGAQVEVAQQNRRLRAGDNEDQKHQKQKSEHVVHLARPQRV